MRFIILSTESDTPINPSEALPPEVRLLFSSELSKLSYHGLELNRLPEHPQYPGWRCCLARAKATDTSLYLVTERCEDELELTLRFKGVAPVLDKPDVQDVINQPEIEQSAEVDEQSAAQDASHDEPNEDHGQQSDLAEESKDADPPTEELVGRDQLDQAEHLLSRLLKDRLNAIEERLTQQSVSSQALTESWSAHELLHKLMTDSEYFSSVNESANWASTLALELNERLSKWGDQPESRRVSILTLLKLMREQGLDSAQPPAWLMTSDGCRAQAEVYRGFLDIYDELSASSVHKSELISSSDM